jgi:hypothetical protein
LSRSSIHVHVTFFSKLYCCGPKGQGAGRFRARLEIISKNLPAFLRSSFYCWLFNFFFSPWWFGKVSILRERRHAWNMHFVIF